MKAIRYGVHCAALAVAGTLFWSLRSFRLPQSISYFDLFQFGLAGALHSTSIVVSLRSRSTTLRALRFIAFATALSAIAPEMGVLGSVIWIPFVDTLREKNVSFAALFITGSALGASCYWLLVQRFLLKPLRRTDWLRTVVLCATATLLVVHSLPILGYDWTASSGNDFSLLVPTFAWWLAFSFSMYLAEDVFDPMRLVSKAARSLCVAAAWLSIMLVVWSFTAVLCAPLDALTMTLPQRVRKAVSAEIIAGPHFEAKSYSIAKRAVKLDPTSENAWTALCAAGVKDGTDMSGALAACSRVATMTDSSFHAYLVANAYDEADRPCDGLPVLRKTMGAGSVSNVSPVLSVGRLEARCGEMEAAENHLREVVRLREEQLRLFNRDDRPLRAGDDPDSYENSERVSLSKARQNLSALLTLRGKDEEALRLCRAALGAELARCTCRFTPREGVGCDDSPAR